MSATSVDVVSLTAADILMSLRVPRGWDASLPDSHSVLVQGPDGATLSVQRAMPEAPGHTWFVDFAAAVPAQLQADLPGFELIDTERFRLSSYHADVLVVSARHDDRTTPATAQVQAYVWVGSDRMYVVGGSTPLEHEARDLPLFTAMVHSLRLLPPRPGS